MTVDTDIIQLVLDNYPTVSVYEAIDIEEKFADEWAPEKRREFEINVTNQIPLAELGKKYELDFNPAAFEDEPYPVGTKLQDVLPKDIDCVCITWHRNGSEQDKRQLVDGKGLDIFTEHFSGISVLRRDMFEKGLPEDLFYVEIMCSTCEILEFRVSGYVMELEGSGFVGESTKECHQMLRELTRGGEDIDSQTTALLKFLLAKREATRLLTQTLAAVRDAK